MGVGIAFFVVMLFSLLSLANGIRLVYANQPENGIAFWMVGVAGCMATIPLAAAMTGAF